MKNRLLIISFVLLILSACSEADDQNNPVNINGSIKLAGRLFENPPLKYKSRPLWFWNAPLSKERTLDILLASKEKGYYGLGILPSHGMSPEYMSQEFLDHYRYVLDIADSLEMKMCLYDEFYFPSGMAGGNLAKIYPGSVSKRLDKEEYTFKGPGVFKQTLNPGNVMGAVAFEIAKLERIDLSDKIEDKLLLANLPKGDWKVMIFYLNPDNSSGRNHVDYLDPSAVEKFIELTYERYYEAFPEHFGTTIDFAFYDEPCLRWVEEGRTWTGSYNIKFIDKYGFSPVEYYPALWYDIGDETSYARNLLYGFRAELFASGFAGTINEWCNDHNIQLTGHVDQEEVLNPVSICGDLITSFKYQDIACVDQIAHYGRASKIYKLVSSAALNYGRHLVATECYGAVSDMPVPYLYKEAMDQFAKGINLMEPHAVWYADKADIPPNLSPSDNTYAEHLEDYNNYIGRLQLLLQGGKHLADIAILYPISSLQADYSFQSGDAGYGGKTSWNADYLDIGEMLSLDTRTDYTFIHPDILDEDCLVEGPVISLNNQSESSEYKIVILPGIKTIKWSNLKKIKDFYDNGGIVIATSVLPEYAVDPGNNETVRNVIRDMFGKEAQANTTSIRAKASSIWNTGGFLPAYAIDGNMNTSWRPSRDLSAGEWLEIQFGREIHTGNIEICGSGGMEHSFRSGWSKTDEDQSFSFNLLIKSDGEWKEAGSWSEKGKDKPVFFKPGEISGIRINITSGKANKISIPEIKIYDSKGENINIVSSSWYSNHNDNGGRAYFTSVPGNELMREIINDAMDIWDIRTEDIGELANGNFSCIHKKLDGQDIYFFANSSDEELDMKVLLRGQMRLKKWDPASGIIEKYPIQKVRQNENDLTRIKLNLRPVQSLFFITY